MAQMGFFVNAPRCTGCKTCALACKDYNDLSEGIAFRQVYEYGSGTWVSHADGTWTTDASAYYLSIACNHCLDPVCVRACPTGAMHKGEFGLVMVDSHRCIGCGYCELSCPYRAPKVDRSVGHSVKCDGCASRVEQGMNPICVDSCSLRALEFGPIDDLRAAHGAVADLAPLPGLSATSPNLVIRRPLNVDEDGILPAGADAGAILNPNDIV